MKIYIIGPSCVGKTTLAKIISKNSNVRHFDLDLVMIDQEYLAQTKIFRYRSHDEYTNRIDKILDNNSDWIIEGAYSIDKIFKKADKVLFLHLPLKYPIVWQWKRFFSDDFQRTNYGLINNIGLTIDILRQYATVFKKQDVGDETITYLAKYCQMILPYQKKVTVLDSPKLLEDVKCNGCFVKN